MAYKQAGGVLNDPVKKRVEGGNENETAASVDRTDTNQRLTNVPMETRPMGSGAVYSKNAAATKSTEGTIGGNVPLTYRNNNKTYRYVPGKQTNDPKTGRLL
jgi:hypothetical protein